MTEFYTYLWLREDGTPYYVGKGRSERIRERHRVGAPPPPERIIIQEWPSEEDAIVAEKLLITIYGREDLGTGRLLNLTDGGEGLINCSVETRRKLAEAKRGKRGNATGATWKHSKESRAKMKRTRASKTARIQLSEAGKRGAAARWQT